LAVTLEWSLQVYSEVRINSTNLMQTDIIINPYPTNVENRVSS